MLITCWNANILDILVKYNILLKFRFTCIYFYNVVTGKFKIPYVDHNFIFESAFIEF